MREEIDDAIAATRRYLLDQQDSDGLWHDSEFPTGEGSDLVTAFVARAVAVLLTVPSEDSPALSDALGRACQALARHQRANGGWAYGTAAPTDAEVSAWALWALTEERRWRPFSTARARRYLSRHIERGGLRPYVRDHDADPGLPDFVVPPGLLEPQPCVTAVAIRSFLDGGPNGARVTRNAIAYLEASQSDDGLWRSALWVGPGLPTLVALAGGHSALLSEETLARAKSGVRDLLKSTEVFEVASAIVPAPRLGILDTEHAVDQLLATQEPDGSWSAAKPVRATLPGLTARTLTADATGPAPPTTDHPYRGRLFVTATVVTALQFQSWAT